MESTRFSSGLSPRQSYSSEGYRLSANLSESDYDVRGRAFSYNGRNSGTRTLSQDGRLSGDWKMPIINRNSDPIITSLSQLPQDHRSSYRNGTGDLLDSFCEFERPRSLISSFLV